MGRNQSVGKIGKDGSQAPAIDLYRRQVISTWSLTVTMDFFFLFQNKYISYWVHTASYRSMLQKWSKIRRIFFIGNYVNFNLKLCVHNRYISLGNFPTYLCILFLQIARQDNKKERKHQKEIKNQTDAQATNSKLFREMVVVLFTLLTIFLVVYAFLYLSVQNRNRDNSE